MQYIVARHNITVYHTCILHSVINVFCTFVQKRCYVIDAKDSEIQYFKVHTTNSLQLLAAKLLLFYDICKFLGKNFRNLLNLHLKSSILEIVQVFYFESLTLRLKGPAMVLFSFGIVFVESRACV